VSRFRSFRQSLRMLRRDWRSGELALIALATAVAVAATTAVAAFVDRVEQAMVAESTSLLGGDLAVSSTRELPASLREAPARRGLASTGFVELRTVAASGERIQLVELKAVEPGYPLRGSLMTADTPFGTPRSRAGGPPPGEVWVEPRLLSMLQLEVGARVRIGEWRPVIGAVLALEPDRGGNLFALAPRVLMAKQDLPATGLVSAASRVTHTLLLAGEAEAVAAFADWLEARELPGTRVRTVSEARPELDTAMSRARLFLGVAAWVSLCIGAVAIGTAARRYAERHLDPVALMRCLGARRSYVLALVCWQLLLVALAAAALGIAAGYGAQTVLAGLLADLASASLPPAGPRAAVTGLLAALVAVFGFGLPPLLAIRDVPPARVLNRAAPASAGRYRWLYLLSVIALALLTPWQDMEGPGTGWLIAGTAGAVLALGLSAAALIALMSPLRGRVGVAWRYGLAALARRPGATLLQAVAIGLGIMVLLLLTTVHRDILARWRASLPPEAPNNFLINIQPEEVAPLSRWLAGRGLEGTELYPMVRARLTAINGEPLDPDAYEDPRARRLATREFNLSAAAELKHDNRVVAGEWWSPGADPGQFSFEQEIAEALGVGIGDRLSYDAAGQSISGRITNVRAVQWDSFEVNFFVLTPPALIEGLPATWITAFYLPPERGALMADLLAEFPSVTVLNVDAVLERVRAIIDGVARAIAFVFLFTLLSGLLVLAAAILASQDARLREAAVLRALGAQSGQIRAAFLAELLSIGAIGGTVAGLCATGTGYLLATRVFRIAYLPAADIVLLGTAAGVAVGALAALAPMRGIMRSRPQALLAAG